MVWFQGDGATWKGDGDEMKRLQHGMILRSKNVMDDAMCELSLLKELVPEVLHGRLEKVIAQFEYTLCTADISDDISRLQEYLEMAIARKKHPA